MKLGSAYKHKCLSSTKLCRKDVVDNDNFLNLISRFLPNWQKVLRREYLNSFITSLVSGHILELMKTFLPECQNVLTREYLNALMTK